MERMKIEKDPVASTRKAASLFPSWKMTQDPWIIRSEREGRMLRCALEPATMRSGKLELR
jgi:hypothetical protein